MSQLMSKKRSQGVLRARSLLLIGLLVGLVGCNSTIPHKVLPPVELIADCPESSIDVTTNAGLANGIVSLRGDLKRCNVDKASLREWAGDAK
jgi:hypothetical protein